MPVSHGLSFGAERVQNVQPTPSLHWTRVDGWTSSEEFVVTEAPLAIEISYERAGRQIVNVLAVTMRTPGHDAELAIGFLLAEGVISSSADVSAVTSSLENARGEAVATQRVQLVSAPHQDIRRMSRGLVTSSACGLCNRPSLDGLPLGRTTEGPHSVHVSAEFLESLPDKLREQQVIFSTTGGSHGAALCDQRGRVLLVREDVGRHNAVDKLNGAALLRAIGMSGSILVLSSRASFELVQKAAASGIPFVLAVGAPSSLAVELAHASGITLIGFARAGRFNVYTHAHRLDTRAPADRSGNLQPAENLSQA